MTLSVFFLICIAIFVLYHVFTGIEGTFFTYQKNIPGVIIDMERDLIGKRFSVVVRSDDGDIYCEKLSMDDYYFCDSTKKIVLKKLVGKWTKKDYATIIDGVENE